MHTYDETMRHFRRGLIIPIEVAQRIGHMLTGDDWEELIEAQEILVGSPTVSMLRETNADEYRRWMRYDLLTIKSMAVDASTADLRSR